MVNSSKDSIILNHLTIRPINESTILEGQWSDVKLQNLNLKPNLKPN